MIYFRGRAVGFGADRIAGVGWKLGKPRGFVLCGASGDCVAARRVVGGAAVVRLVRSLRRLQCTRRRNDVRGFLTRLDSDAAGAGGRRLGNLRAGHVPLALFVAGLIAGFVSCLIARFAAGLVALARLMSCGLGRFGGGLRPGDLLGRGVGGVGNDAGSEGLGRLALAMLALALLALALFTLALLTMFGAGFVSLIAGCLRWLTAVLAMLFLPRLAGFGRLTGFLARGVFFRIQLRGGFEALADRLVRNFGLTRNLLGSFADLSLRLSKCLLGSFERFGGRLLGRRGWMRGLLASGLTGGGLGGRLRGGLRRRLIELCRIGNDVAARFLLLLGVGGNLLRELFGVF